MAFARPPLQGLCLSETRLPLHGLRLSGTCLSLHGLRVGEMCLSLQGVRLDDTCTSLHGLTLHGLCSLGALSSPLGAQRACLYTAYRAASLTRKRAPLGPYRRPMPSVLGGWAFSYGRGTWGGGLFLMNEVPLYGWTPSEVVSVRVGAVVIVQGYLTDEKTRPPRTLK